MLKAKLLGATAAAEVVAIEDVFSTYLYTGNGSTQTITNGIDLAGEGGLVWIKSRSAATDNLLFDTLRGTTNRLITNSTNTEAALASSVTAFNPNGFSIGNATGIGVNNATYASWTFRKAPRFFDVVTYTGTGANRTIAHDLGVVPGCIIIKQTTSPNVDWQVYHRSNANTEYMVLNTNADKATGATLWNSTTPTSSVFSLGTSSDVNASGRTYVAYLYAHDPLGPSGDGSDGLIACGSYTGNGSATGPTVSLGWEPQWLMIKRATGIAGNWQIVDNMRGMPVGSADATLQANLSNAESSVDYVSPSATGFQVVTVNDQVNASGSTYTYIAIRRGPMREPTVGTQVFAPAAQTGNTFVTSGFPVDFALYRNRADAGPVVAQSRLTGGTKYLYTSRTSAEGTVAISNPFEYNNGFRDYFLSGTAAFYELFRRAPGFFDVVAYSGQYVSGAPAEDAVRHNLGVAPEMVIVRKRSFSGDPWRVQTLPTGTNYMNLNTTDAAASGAVFTALPDATYFYVDSGSGSVNYLATDKYIAYLFASLPGISKVGSYTGNGSSQTINCAFTTGARFVLIKRTDSTGDWYVWDTARGIVTGNDGRISLNAETAEVTSDDTIDPHSTGFIVNQVAATNVNVNAATYIFLAIA